eukprot:CAMPEP_0196658662 /NCGR_PEP_ID=MMETSP1086-20130531/30776_1 /TAXON_ID=77921 /ORGANISM="Cyanoptyche  gloeocystis , Strain SAG4.97" /LENGTH=255 /DNA_ID=CAMNT_0041992321 /DNA_START=12 /DNA_END=779 /DNA_ORIENTATION=+
MTLPHFLDQPINQKRRNSFWSQSPLHQSLPGDWCDASYQSGMKEDCYSSFISSQPSKTQTFPVLGEDRCPQWLPSSPYALDLEPGSHDACTELSFSSASSAAVSRCQSPGLSDHLDSSGSECGADNLNRQKDGKDTRFKTELCRNWEEKGACPYGRKCLFAHGFDELRNSKRNILFKTSPCYWYYRVGICYHGPRCVFAHRPPFFDDTRSQASDEELVRSHRLPIFKNVTDEAQQQLSELEVLRQRQWYRHYLGL